MCFHFACTLPVNFVPNARACVLFVSEIVFYCVRNAKMCLYNAMSILMMSIKWVEVPETIVNLLKTTEYCFTLFSVVFVSSLVWLSVRAPAREWCKCVFVFVCVCFLTEITWLGINSTIFWWQWLENNNNERSNIGKNPTKPCKVYQRRAVYVTLFVSICCTFYPATSFNIGSLHTEY